MIETKITVSGLGTCINYEMEVIKRAFEAAGIEVTVINDYPEKDIEGLMKHVEKIKDRKIKIKLVADHQPWGG